MVSIHLGPALPTTRGRIHCVWYSCVDVCGHMHVCVAENSLGGTLSVGEPNPGLPTSPQIQALHLALVRQVQSRVIKDEPGGEQG